MTTSIGNSFLQDSGASAAGSARSVIANSATRGKPGEDHSESITANDFLTLLVTEMKNQDPTANTDPNEYVNQLVQVNSLQQLISINQTLQSALSTLPNAETRGWSRIRTPVSNTQEAPSKAVDALVKQASHGNLTVLAQQPSSLRLATALVAR